MKISASRGEHALHPVEQLDRGVDVDRLAGVGTLGTLGTPVADAEVDEVRGVLLRHLDRGGDEGLHLGGVLTADGAVGVGAGIRRRERFLDKVPGGAKRGAEHVAVPLDSAGGVEVSLPVLVVVMVVRVV